MNIEKVMVRSLAVFVVPFVCFCALAARSPNEMSVGLFIVFCIPNSILFALPQIIWSLPVLILSGKAVPAYYWGGLVAAHLLIIAFIWYVIHFPGDGDGTWVLGYYLLSVPTIAIGAFIGACVKWARPPS